MTQEEQELFQKLNQQLETTNKLLYSQQKILYEIKQKNEELEKHTSMIDKRIADWQTAKFFWILTLILIGVIIFLNIYPYIQTWYEEWKITQEFNKSMYNELKRFYH